MRTHFHFFNEMFLPFSMKAKELNCVLAIFAVEDFYILDLQRKYVTAVKELNGSLRAYSVLALCCRETKMPAGSAPCHLAVLLLLSSTPLWAAEISCRNEDGEMVDWFALYKLPKHAKGEIPMLGLEYMYMDTLAPQWQLGKYLINMTQGALGQTLKQLYEMYESERNSIAYAIYNDEVPESDSNSWQRGHTKDQQMLSYNPGIYSCSIPNIFQADLPNLQKLCAGSRLPSVPLRHLSKLQSAQGETFLHFAKSHLFIDDIYVAWMAQELKTDLLAESWQHSGQKLPSNCSLNYHVYNINLIGMPLNSTFYSINDHSKWAVSRKSKDQWTCIGDLNRAAEQAWRSGGFICTQNEHIYKAFRHLIIHYKNCTNTFTWM
ncbi:deoxyribonuclease-2-beta isoform X2 [Tyto alba]|uniref:deoxyribonuclease-2-beta isoform X2 n=1 Tax=Tyto alba TaxID=56313 RepID=UPI001402B20A|nr:deoxyribonuclease-2-beta isoform X2 [Tyto alba]